ncbi:MAG: dTDP-4-dehydrorhamnose reductase [Hyphomonadaceae bacterium]
MATRLLVLGARGQLARALADASAPFTITAWSRDQLNLNDLGAIGPAIETFRPDAVINAAAYNAVDAAETDSEGAFRINRDAPAHAAQACARLGIPFVHVSTDFVFDGTKGAPYAETDAPRPLNVYGASKAAGEQAVEEAGARSAIVRTSWVHSAHGSNFVRTMLHLAETNETVRVVGDQIGSPTWAFDLTSAVLKLTEGLLQRDPGAEGVFHYCNAGGVSRADFAAAAIAGAARRGLRTHARVVAITTAEWPAPAARPHDSRLDCARYAFWAGAAPPPWEASLERCLDEMFAPQAAQP